MVQGNSLFSGSGIISGRDNPWEVGERSCHCQCTCLVTADGWSNDTVSINTEVLVEELVDMSRVIPWMVQVVYLNYGHRLLPSGDI